MTASSDNDVIATIQGLLKKLDSELIKTGLGGPPRAISPSTQGLYSSQSGAKIDLSGATVAVDTIKADESGFYIAGAKVFQWPWVGKLEKLFGTESASSKDLKKAEDRIKALETLAASDAGRTAASQNRDIYGYKEESERSLGRIKEIHTEARVFADEINRRTNEAKDELLRVVNVIDQAIGGSH
jgi:hypothetical protein